MEIDGNEINCTIKLNYQGEEYSATKTAIKTSVNRKKVVARQL